MYKFRKRISILMSVFMFISVFMSLSPYTASASDTSNTAYVNKSEFRAAWFATVSDIDWTTGSATAQKNGYTNTLDTLKNAGFNAIIFQVRPMGDAFYPSSYAPWSKYIDGQNVKNPGYDPLAFAVSEVHKRGMEFHAWFNPFRIGTGTTFSVANYINSLPTGSALRAHPEWIEKYGDSSQAYYFINPGIPEARQYIINTIMEVVNNYDIDAVHLDDYFYPYPISGATINDSTEYKKYGTGYSNINDWRRDNVNKFIQALSTTIKNKKSYVKFGVSPFGIWKNGLSNGGSDTNGLSSYNDLYTDSLKWVNNQWIDYIIPQIYWNIGYKPAAYEKLISWWTQQLNGKNVSLYIGQAAYKVNNDNTAWSNANELPNQIILNRKYSVIKGSAFFSVNNLTSNKLGILTRLKADLYKYKAVIPAMPWKVKALPAAPIYKSVKKVSAGNEINWTAARGIGIKAFAIYRFNPNEKIDTTNEIKLLSIVSSDDSGSYKYVDTTASSNQSYIYGITAMDRLYNESGVIIYDTSILPTVKSITTDKASPQKVNNVINITVNSTGGTNPLYRFSIYDGTKWTVVKQYSADTHYSWYPATSGTYTIKVDAKDNASTNDFDSSKQILFQITKKYKVAIDAGHGGIDTGAIGYSKTYEKNLNLSIAKKVQSILLEKGIDVLMTRTTDTYPTLDQRVAMINNWGADVSVSIHQNSYDTQTPNGIETYSYPGKVTGANLAAKLQAQLIKNTGAYNRGAKTANFEMVRETNMPSALVECGFITNPSEEAKLKTDNYQNTIASSIANGIMDFLNANNTALVNQSINKTFSMLGIGSSAITSIGNDNPAVDAKIYDRLMKELN